nr:1981_t:CDS:2 [Entrophospora candida]
MGANNSTLKDKADKKKKFLSDDGGDFISNTDDYINVLPINEGEAARTDELHFVLKTLNGESNFVAPIDEKLKDEDGFRVLDVGCGNGSWTLDMATEYKKAKFTALDILPIFPNEIRPKNVDFALGNILKGLDFESDTFDYVFMRCMKAAISNDNWPKVIRELLRILKPNGWLELCEIDGGFVNGSPEADSCFNRMEEKLLKKYGISLDLIELLKKTFTDHFHSVVDVQYIRKDLPLCGRWDDPDKNKIAEVCRRNISWGAKNIGQAVDFLGLKPKEYEEYIEKVFDGTKNCSYCTMAYYRIIVRKLPK